MLPTERGAYSDNTTSYQYDANGNRTSLNQNGTTYLSAIAPSSNRLLTVQGPAAKTYNYDPAGNLTSDGTAPFTWNAAGRLSKAASGGQNYTYTDNGLGERILKNGTTLANGPYRFVYDQAGHLIGEYDKNNSLRQETVWLGDTPVAVVKPAPTPQQVQVYYIQTDHLNAPRIILNNANIPVWRWDHADAFGTTLPNEDPDGDGNTFEYNLRFPGQYYDQETGLYYNYFRDYDPGTGRYIQSDPIGLKGGLNTYAYTYNNPVNLIDPDGRIPIVGIGLRLLAAFMPMIDLQMMAVDDMPGGGIGKACSLEKGAIALTKSRFGHTFTTHGQDATDFLINRAAGSGKPVGQFLDDQAAARLIQDNLSNLKNGAISVTVPNYVPVRIIMPDGSFAPASTIRLVPGGNGVKTAYPEP